MSLRSQGRFYFMSLLVIVMVVASVSGTSLAQTQVQDEVDIDKGSLELLSAEPMISLSAVNKDGKVVEGTNVVVFLLSGDASEVVFQDEIGKDGKVSFKSKLPNNVIEQAPGNVADAVYEVYFVSPEREIKRDVFSVPHVKASESVSRNDLLQLERERVKEVQITFTGEKLTIEEEKENSAQSRPSDCTHLGRSVYKCSIETRDYTEKTKIGEIHLGDQEKGAVTFRTSAKVGITSGLKLSSKDRWENDRSVSLSAQTTTGVNYNITGGCSGTVCNRGRNLYAQYDYLYEHDDIYWGDRYLRSEYKVTPVKLRGPNTSVLWFQHSMNGKSISDVRARKFGGWFQISKEASKTEEWKREKSFSNAFTVNTPVGSFSSAVKTEYATANSITYSTDHNSRIFYHYDNDNNDQYFVTF